ncbi:MAG TPA: NAD-dependent epimerase/dehydratase family protein [Gracilimonas sp.]|uniref:NAD-dependent epimerase/dehydratase family protein n=1 Tax=Gracilimonas sp. TaxID=1974203 RepID=UPI002D97E4EC|nr:NAD-dependent epimerase/dehydratase family protein [Gracilimonas sp.]
MTSLKGKKVLVTGATGFLGSRLAELLADKEKSVVTGIGRNLERVAHLREKGIDLKKVDILNTEDIEKVVTGQDYVFHSAAIIDGDHDAGQKVNVDATKALVETSGKKGVSRFIHVSTLAVYDMPQTGEIGESTPLALNHSAMYNRTKSQAEKVAREMAEKTNLELSIIRPSMIYGPGYGIWSEGMFNLILNDKPVYIGDGSTNFYPVYVDDVVQALILCAKSPNAVGEAYNIVHEVTDWKTFMDHYAKIVNKETKGIPLFIARMMAWGNKIPGIKTPIDQGFIEMANSYNTFPTQKAKNQLGWKPETSLREGLQNTTEWLKQEIYKG